MLSTCPPPDNRVLESAGIPVILDIIADASYNSLRLAEKNPKSGGPLTVR